MTREFQLISVCKGYQFYELIQAEEREHNYRYAMIRPSGTIDFSHSLISLQTFMIILFLEDHEHEDYCISEYNDDNNNLIVSLKHCGKLIFSADNWCDVALTLFDMLETKGLQDLPLPCVKILEV